MKKKIFLALGIFVVVLISFCVVFANKLQLVGLSNDKQSIFLKKHLSEDISDDFNAIFYDEENNCIEEYGNIDIKFSPGSLFKCIVYGIALNENIVNEMDSFECNGILEKNNFSFKCYQSGGHGDLTYSEAVNKSCPLAYIKLAERIEDEVFFSYLGKLGFSDLIRKDKINIAMGQNIEITPLQILSAYNKIFIRKEIFSEECIGKLLKCIKKDNTDLVTIEAIATKDDEYYPVVIAFDERKISGIAFSEKLTQKEIEKILKKIFQSIMS